MMDLLKSLLAAFAAIGVAVGGSLFMLAIAVIVICLILTGFGAMLGLSVAILWFIIQLGLAYIVGSIIHFVAEKILAWLYDTTQVSFLAYPYQRHRVSLAVAVIGVLWIWFG
ncbi:hypothetical protein [Mitsuokella sp. AF33-22]|uniref:hypothetical protein n=1 Tax=Mitsuokella sp. AF33-22 TaxID=2292047 RepID=UPI0011C34898|nr:hypothetical protein [Mitsuokella sp. AF33-22]